MNVPEAVGVPLIVKTFEAHAGVTPAGRPVAVPIPVAPVVVLVMLVNAVLMQSVGVEDAVPAVLTGETVKTPLGWVVPFQKPLNAPPYCQEQPLMR